MALEKCPHMMARCPHKQDACSDAASKECHYISNTVGTAISTRAALVMMRATVGNRDVVDDNVRRIDDFLSQNFGIKFDDR